MKRVCLAALLVTAALSAHADGERWGMIPACDSAVRMMSALRTASAVSTVRSVRLYDGYRLLHAEEDFAARVATIEYATRDDHGTFVHHSAQCLFWHHRMSGMSIDGDVEGQIIVD
ncbi:hypothetical protein [Mesorhizobium sophorae]|uniref:hypothetical protein n=1 Tax=Mesorhizobium sophorae TaxID=1300294 RepID=UPI000BA343F1|nr:hypothetical protein [Mesorhizobium sophorae]